MNEKNEFKFSALRQFGSENLSFTATIHSDKVVLSDEEIQGQVNQINTVINKAFVATQEREITEKQLLADASDRRKAAVKVLDEALKDEMLVKGKASLTAKEAEKLSEKLGRIAK